ncbi:MAG: PilZ domain-containing protein [Myxococcaceae bacterium]|nr:PilZ domain-containing protein [Myxococcaceae bacterium]
MSAPATLATASRPGADAVLSRAGALASLQRAPALPDRASGWPTRVPSTDPRRRFPRASIKVRARLSLADDPARVFEASLPTVNVSVGGLFLESSYFLELGTRLLVHLELPPHGRVVQVKAEVVRIEANGDGPSGFALRFTDYIGGSEVVLATHFLSPVLKEFITTYAKQHRFDASAEYIAHTADVLAAWELAKAELGGDVWSLTSLS